MRCHPEFAEHMQEAQMDIEIMVETDVEMVKDNWAGPKLDIEIPGQHGAWRCDANPIMRKCKRDDSIQTKTFSTKPHLNHLGADY